MEQMVGWDGVTVCFRSASFSAMVDRHARERQYGERDVYNSSETLDARRMGARTRKIMGPCCVIVHVEEKTKTKRDKSKSVVLLFSSLDSSEWSMPLVRYSADRNNSPKRV